MAKRTANTADLHIAFRGYKRNKWRWCILGIINEDSLRQKVGTLFLPHLNYLRGRGERQLIRNNVIGIQTKTLQSSELDLVYVLAEGWNGGELADEVEVGGGEGVNSAAVKHGQGLVGGQSQVLKKEGKSVMSLVWGV